MSDAVSITTNAAGTARALFEVTMQPGDNFRVAASLKLSELGKISDDSVPANSTPPKGFNGAVTDMLTTWRRLWIERDAMTGVTANAVNVSVTAVTPNVAMPGTGGANDILTLAGPLGQGDDAFTGGTLTFAGFGGKSVRVYLNRDLGGGATLNVPGGSFTPAERALIAAGPVAATIIDDDVIPAAPGTMPLPSGGNPVVTAYGTTGDFMSNAFGTAYILPLYVDPGPESWNTVGTVPMVVPIGGGQSRNYRHLANDLDAISATNRDLVSAADFWTTLVVGSFERFFETDGDPACDPGPMGPGVPIQQVSTDTGGWDFGWSGDPSLAFPDQNRSAIFLETIRDVGPANGYKEAEIVTHEIGHTAGGGKGLPHTKTGLMMQVAFAGQTQFDNYSLKRMREVGVW